MPGHRLDLDSWQSQPRTITAEQRVQQPLSTRRTCYLRSTIARSTPSVNTSTSTVVFKDVFPARSQQQGERQAVSRAPRRYLARQIVPRLDLRLHRGGRPGCEEDCGRTGPSPRRSTEYQHRARARRSASPAPGRSPTRSAFGLPWRRVALGDTLVVSPKRAPRKPASHVARWIRPKSPKLDICCSRSGTAPRPARVPPDVDSLRALARGSRRSTASRSAR